ncbi:UNVERIFIED_CONTAM: hypothetical protein H355_001926, partial [Colinus virginianus]
MVIRVFVASSSGSVAELSPWVKFLLRSALHLRGFISVDLVGLSLDCGLLTDKNDKGKAIIVLKTKFLLFLPEFLTFCHVEVGLERRNVLRCIKKRQQDVVRFLEANRIEFEEVDITMSEEKRQWMYKNIPEDRQPAQGNPLPPQIFSDDRYCG